MKPRVLAMTLVVAVVFASAAWAARMPVLTWVNGPLRARPRVVDLSVDGAVLLAGQTGQHPTQSTPGDPFGRLHWTTWNALGGRAWGAEWRDTCRPSCAQGTYHAHKATVHVFDPDRHGVFLRMTVKTQRRRHTYIARHLDGGWGWT